jgi:hypothetical protein
MAEYEEIPQHIAEMPEGYRIMKVGETITEDTQFWFHNKGPWTQYSDKSQGFCVGDVLIENEDCHPFPHCCPVDVQKQPEINDTSDSGEPVSDKERISELENQVGELNAANDKLQGVIAQYDNQNIDDQSTIKNLKKEREELIATDKRQTDYIDDLHREHEAEVNELKRKLDASAEASTHERTTVHLLTEKLVKAEGVREYLESTIERLRDEK